MATKEQWKFAPGSKSVEVSTLGRVRKNGGTPSYGASAGTGGMYRSTRMDGVYCSIHKLVLETFVGPPSEIAFMALHRNDVANDNRLSNLYWGSYDDNMADKLRNRGTLLRKPEFMKHRTIGAWAPVEVADMLQVYAQKHHMTQSQAIVELLAKGLKLAKPESRPVGRPRAS